MIKTKEYNLIEGNVNSTLLKFTVPFLISSLIQTLYGIVDLLIVGRFSDTKELAAVSISSTAMAAFSMFVIGLSVGATVVIGQHFGAGDKDAVKKASGTAFALYPIISLGLMVVFMFLSKPLLVWMDTDPEIMNSAHEYLMICLAGLVFTGLYNTLSAVLRGFGDSIMPMIFVAIAGVFNLFGDLILVAGFGMGAAGAAIATTVAQALSFFIGIIYVGRKEYVFSFKPKDMKIDKSQARTLLSTGAPIAIQNSLPILSFVIIAGIINGLGYVSVAAAGALDKMFLFANIPTTAFESSISAMGAQNIGAGKVERARQCLWAGIGWAFSFSALFFVMSILWPEVLMGCFSKDPAVIEAGVLYFRGYKYDFILCSLTFCLHGLFNGAGHTRFTLANNMISTFAIRVPAVWLLSKIAGATLFHLGWGLPMASVVQLICALLYYKSGRWTKSV